MKIEELRRIFINDMEHTCQDLSTDADSDISYEVVQENAFILTDREAAFLVVLVDTYIGSEKESSLYTYVSNKGTIERAYIELR